MENWSLTMGAFVDGQVTGALLWGGLPHRGTYIGHDRLDTQILRQRGKALLRPIKAR